MDATNQTTEQKDFSNAVAVKVYRGWAIHRNGPRFCIHKEQWQSYFNFKDIESAQAKIDAIVG